MKVAIIIGNTTVRVAGFDDEGIKRKFSLSTRYNYTEDEIYIMFELFGITHLEDAVIASAVPSLNPLYESVLKGKFGITQPLRVSWDLNTGLVPGYSVPGTMGEDRIANVVGAFHEYRKNIAIVDFGTATTVDFVTEDGKHLGGIIAPGIKASFENLVKRTSKLFDVEIKKPERFIGQSTEECMRSGIYLLSIGFIESVKAAVKRETKKEFTFIATGGLAETLAGLVPAIDAIDPDLGIKGLIHLYRLNR